MRTKDKKLIYSIVAAMFIIVVFVFVFGFLINRNNNSIYITLYNPINNSKQVVKIKEGESIDDKFKHLEIKGFKFIGWFYDNELTQKVENGDYFKTSKVLKAGYSKIIDKSDNEIIEYDFSKYRHYSIKTSNNQVLTIEDINYINTFNIYYLDLKNSNIENKKIEKNQFSNNSNLRYINIPANCDVISEGAFKNCFLLENIVFNNVKIIEKQAFVNCENLTSLDFNIEEIQENVFIGCDKLTNISFGKNLKNINSKTLYNLNLKNFKLDSDNEFYTFKDGVLYSKDYKNIIFATSLVSKNLQINENVKIIEDYAFFNNEIIETICFYENLEKIGESSFENCKNLEKIQFSACQNLKIFDYAFKKCKLLEDITLPVGTSYLGKGCFEYCDNLSNVIFNITTAQNVKSLESIHNKCFKDCVRLKQIIIPDSVTYLGNEVFSGCINLQEVKLSGQIKSIPEKTFYNNENLVNLTTASIENVGNYAFYNCYKINKIDTLKNIKNLGVYTFYNCENLNKLNFNDVSVIPEGCFYNCLSLNDITFNNIENIGMLSFYNCVGLKYFNIGSNVIDIEVDAFENCINLEKFICEDNNKFIVIDGVLYNNQKNAIICYPYGKKSQTFTIKENIQLIKDKGLYFNIYLKEIKVDDGNSFYFSEDGVLYDLEKTTIYKYPNDKDGSIFEIPENVLNVGNYCFTGNNNLKELTFSSKTKTIGEYVLFNAKCLKKLTIPFIGSSKNTDKYIGYLFGSKSYITNDLFIPNSLNELIVTNDNVIAEYTFYNTSSIKYIEFNKEVTSIHQYAFFGAKNLEEIYFKGSIIFISKYAFYNMQNLKSIKLNINESFVLEKNSFGKINYVLDIYIYNSKNRDYILRKFQSIYDRSKVWIWHF